MVEESPKARPCFNDALALSCILICMNDTATQSLVVPLDVVVLHIFFDGVAKMLLSKRNYLVQTLGLDGQDKPFRERIQIRTSTLKKSIAARTSQCASRKVFQGVPVFIHPGAGSMSWSPKDTLYCIPVDIDPKIV